MKAPQEIILTGDGFMLRNGTSKASLSFSEVTAIRAEKIDLLTADEIRVVFDCVKKAPFEISEELPGFGPLMERVLSRFVGSDSRWFEKVTQPAFASCPTTIWKEVPNQPSEPTPGGSA